MSSIAYVAAIKMYSKAKWGMRACVCACVPRQGVCPAYKYRCVIDLHCYLIKAMRSPVLWPTPTCPFFLEEEGVTVAGILSPCALLVDSTGLCKGCRWKMEEPLLLLISACCSTGLHCCTYLYLCEPIAQWMLTRIIWSMGAAVIHRHITRYICFSDR